MADITLDINIQNPIELDVAVNQIANEITLTPIDVTINIPNGGGGSGITSLTFTAPIEFLVAGSPLTGPGTIALTKATQTPNLVYAGPASGSTAAQPTFRALVAADLPATPVVAQNLFYAGPTSGAAAVPTFRAITAADLPASTTTLQSLTDVQITEPTYVNTGLTISSFSATTITCTATVSGLVIGDFIRGTNTPANAPFAAITNISGSIITVATTTGFGFANGGSIFRASSTALNNQVLAYSLPLNRWTSVPPATGGITTVGLVAPAEFTVTGSPLGVPGGTITIGKVNQPANTFYAGPNGTAGSPGFRTMVGADIAFAASSTLPGPTAGVGFIGTSTNYARADHGHALGITTTGTSGPTTFTAGVLNIPNYYSNYIFPTGLNLVSTTDTQTLTNKTINGAIVSSFVEPVINVTASAGGITIDASSGSLFLTTLNGASTLTITNITTPLTADNRSFSFAIIDISPATVSFINAITITGATTTTVHWIGGVPTAGGVGSDLYQINVIRISSGTYRVIASIALAIA